MYKEIQWQGFILSAMSYDHADLSSSPLLFENIDTLHPFTNFQKSKEFSTLQQSLLPLFRWKIKAGSTIEGNYFHATKQWYSWDYISGLQTPIPPVSSLSTLPPGLETHLEGAVEACQLHRFFIFDAWGDVRSSDQIFLSITKHRASPTEFSNLCSTKVTFQKDTLPLKTRGHHLFLRQL